jgi:hypothetical protein
MLVSRTTRTWRSHRRDLCGNLLRGEGTKLLGGATQLANHTPKSLTTGLAFRRLQNHHVGSPPDGQGFTPTLTQAEGVPFAAFSFSSDFNLRMYIQSSILKS